MPDAADESGTAVTRLLREAESGKSSAAEDLLPLVYDQLHEIARIRMGAEETGHTLQATALVHEAYMKLVRADLSFHGRAHFYRAAAQAMRRILVDHARTKGRAKRGGGRRWITLDVAELAT